MPAAKLPEDEDVRLADLQSYGLLDTPPDARFDLYVDLASRMYGVPMSMISLIDSDRQWFKAVVGLDATETPRESAFCAHAILKPNDVLVVEDALTDERFLSNPLVTGAPNIRFYAGAPIVSPKGHALGTLCIIDSEPRLLDTAERSQLADLARAVGSVFELHRASALLHRFATQDGLTGLANRAMFDQSLEQAIGKSSEDAACAVLLLDLDKFKRVNDTHGHAGGDVMLRMAGSRLRALIGPRDIAARLGGDEFAVLLAAPQTAATAEAFAARLIASFAEPVQLGADAIPIRTSVGYALAPLHAGESAGLMLAADIALYRAKAAGRGRIEGAIALEWNRAPATAHTLEDDLRAALLRGEFTLAWQGCVRLPGLEPKANEALLRWRHPVHGLMPPAAFIPIAESSGQIAAIDEFVLRKACRQAAAWPNTQAISVNLGAYWLRHRELAGVVAAILAETGLTPHRLVLEVTEGTVIDDVALAATRVAELHQLGVRVALDNFGTGYTSLACLTAVPFDVIKLDRSLVHALGTTPHAEAVLRSLVRLGRGLGMLVCAEGVETEAQLAFLNAEGCDLAQGFLFQQQASEEAVLF